MLHLIDFLERCGQDADLRHASADVVDEALRGIGIDPALRTAILNKDQRTLEALLGVRTNVCCMIHKEDEEEEEEEEPEDEDDEHGDEEEHEAVLADTAGAQGRATRAA